MGQHMLRGAAKNVLAHAGMGIRTHNKKLGTKIIDVLQAVLRRH